MTGPVKNEAPGKAAAPARPSPGVAGQVGEPHSPQPFSSAPVERLVMLSDGVFAIAMTLLALDLIPESTELLHEEALTNSLLKSWPPVLSFMVSFWVISVFWRAHSELFRWVAHRNRWLTRLNLVLLMLVCFLPFPTAILGDHGPETPAIVFYSLSVMVGGLAQIALCAYVLHRPDLLRGDTPASLVGEIILRSSIAVTVFGAAAILAVFDPLLGMLLWFVTPLVGRLARQRFPGGRPSAA